MLQLKILVDTVLKQQPVPAAKLPAGEQQAVKAGTRLNLQAFLPVHDHIKVTLADQQFQGKNTWFVYQNYAAILTAQGTVQFPSSTKLAVPYYDQLDNTDDPYGTCNVTSVAMVLDYFHVVHRSPSQRLPDELHAYCDQHGLDRHTPTDLAKVVTAYGCQDDFRTTASFEEVREWLVQGNPAIVHGYFTPSGHIICLIGYDPTGFIVNDPYGELMYSPYHSYYNTYASGAGLHYSYSLMYNTAYVNNAFWVHFISKP